ncbi:MAG: nicotinate-nucleotide--dimethylbenzimidazole phosphoribosyltransferase [Oscillospiraceae bacterium]|nr:nicotinate-nucleotide--dimethylbenzimidazole phosphoribosyltransferase [Oscillospiraceae bacterium]
MAFHTVEEVLAAIVPDQREESARQAARRQWAAVAKPLGSLGLLETALEDIAALTLDAAITLDRRTLLLLCADNGVVAQGVTQTDSGVTAVVARSAAAGRSSVCRMARVADCQVTPVDMGVLDLPPTENILDRRIGNGTGDITQGPAMSREQVRRAVLAGVGLVREQKERGVRLLATGEMGIGNTTTTSAVACVLLDRPAKDLTGRGAGLSDQGLRRKIWAVETAITANRPDPLDSLDVLAKVGGFDLAGLCGVFLGGAAYRVPVLMDGLISTVAALCAVRLCPETKKALLASHVSAEPAGQLVLDQLGKKPLITAEMRLGEGTGAVAAIPLLDMALALYRDGTTFDGYGMQAYTPQG